MKRTGLIILIALVFASAGLFVLLNWRKAVVAKQQARMEAAAVALLDQNSPNDALTLLKSLQRQKSGTISAEEKARWGKLELRAGMEMKNVLMLISCYQRFPDQVAQDEEASLMVARGLLASGRTQEAAKLRARWKGREKQEENWLCYDADEALHRDKVQEAIQILQSKSFSGKVDIGRLLRLAMLNARHPAAAIANLQAAYAADPKNLDVRSFRGQILERGGQEALARVEYVAAVLAAPKNPLMRDQLAEFYLRQQNYAEAVQTMEEALQTQALDYMWVKALFWTNITLPFPTELKGKVPPEGALQPLADFMLQLPAVKFWNEADFDKLPQQDESAKSRQDIFWLRLFQDLQDHHESEARDLLHTHLFKGRSYAPTLEQVLNFLLIYRAEHLAPQLGDFVIDPAQQHPYLLALAAWSKGRKSPEMEAFAASPYAFAGACLVTGWAEAALKLAPTDRALGDAPEWYIYGIAQALRQNRGNEPALAFLHLQTATPLVHLLIGENSLAKGDLATASAELGPLAKTTSDAGYRAAWLLAISAMEQKKFPEALALVQGSTRLASSLLGKELAAKIALKEGDEASASAQYAALEKDSAEAQAYLARTALKDKRWDEARRLTGELVAEFPDELILRKNLEEIDKASAKP
jgi:hypothetical protein